MEPISAIAGLIDTAINRIWPDPAAKASAEAQLMKAQAEAALAAVQQQIDLNKIEAGHQSVFVSGWRPFVGWVCGTAFAVIFVVLPVANWIAQVSGGPKIDIEFDVGTLLTVLTGMLGLGGLRTIEKFGKVARK